MLMQESFDNLDDFFVRSGGVVAHIELDFELAGGDIVSSNAAVEVSNLESGWREWSVSGVPNNLAELGQERQDLMDGIYGEVGVGSVALYSGKCEDSVE